MNNIYINKQLVILHIPKTAGTSLRSVVLDNYNRDECYFIYAKDSVFNTINDFSSLPDKEKMRYKLVMGHFPYSHPEIKKLNANYITIVRNPVDRVISYYNHKMNDFLKQGKEVVSLIKYLTEYDDIQVSNLQTRSLANNPKRNLSENDFRDACYNMNNEFTYIGLTEKFNDLINYLTTKFHWKTARKIEENINPNKNTIQYYSKYEINLLKDMNHFDLLLYDYALKLKHSEASSKT